MIEYETEGIKWLANKLGRQDIAKNMRFSDLENTTKNTIAFWDGEKPLDKPIFGIVLVSNDKQKKQLKAKSKYEGCPDIIVCNEELPHFFWEVMSRVIRLHFDKGSFWTAGDEFTHYENKKAWVSSFADIGKHVRLGSDSIIGTVGIATYQKKPKYILKDIPHIGRLIIGKHSRIGSRVVMSRGILGETIIGDNTVIGTGSIIGHNVRIGNNCFIGPNCTICGSAILENNIWVGASSTITNNAYLIEQSKICAGSIVNKQYDEAKLLVGNPAKSIRKL